jgi:dTDP-4-dehydrorhamnose reductase
VASGREFNHPALNVPGWWHRPLRLIFDHAVEDSGQRVRPPAALAQRDVPITTARPILIAGATGTLGQVFARLCEVRGLPYRLMTRQELDIADLDSVQTALAELRPWAIVNAAGYVRVDEAEQDRERCYRENADGPALLADACAGHGIQLLTFSSDLVFDGAQRTPYVESTTVAPLNVYGGSKAAAEARVLAALPGALVVRTSAFFGPWDRYNFITGSLRALASGERIMAAEDTLISPTYAPDLAHACLDLLLDGADGIWHLANVGAISWADLARQAAEMAGLDASGVVGCAMADLGLAAPRPRYGVLGSERAALLPALDDALQRYLDHCDETLWRQARVR